MKVPLDTFWSLPALRALEQLGSGPQGLSTNEFTKHMFYRQMQSRATPT